MKAGLLKRNEFYLLLVIVVFAAAITIVNPAFLTIENLFDLIRSSSGMAILAVGFFLVLLSGGIDISFPAVAIVAQYVTVNAIIALGIDNLADEEYWAFHPYTQRTVAAELTANF